MVKRGLCIGINYPGTNAELRGCINDANLWKSYFEERGYEITLMVDDGSTTLGPTRQNILNAIDNLVVGLTDQDSIVLTYSGH